MSGHQYDFAQVYIFARCLRCYQHLGKHASGACCAISATGIIIIFMIIIARQSVKLRLASQISILIIMLGKGSSSEVLWSAIYINSLYLLQNE